MKSNLVSPLELFSIRNYILNIKFAPSCFDINGSRQYEFLKRENLNLNPPSEFARSPELSSQLEPRSGRVPPGSSEGFASGITSRFAERVL